jgi:hypothetical protein
MPSRTGLARVVKADSQVLQLNGTTVAPGKRCVVNLPVPGLYAQADFNLAVHVINGRQPGPKVFISAAIHGNELNGVEIIRRLLQQKSLRRLSGMLIAVPIVNVFGIMQHSRFLPDGRDLNRSFPGSQKGSLAARLADIFFEQIVNQCDYGVDLHTGSNHRVNLPQIRGNLDDPETLRLARAFGVPVLLNSDLRDGSLREKATAQGVPVLLYEAGEALRFDELSIRAGVTGILQVLRALNMLPVAKRQPTQIEPFIARSSAWERAPTSGILRNTIKLGSHVKKSDLMGVISDPADCFTNQRHEVRSRVDGVVIGHTRLPLVNEGDALFHIARFADSGEVAAGVESFRDEVIDPPGDISRF